MVVPTKRVDLWQPYMNLPQGGKIMAECESVLPFAFTFLLPTHFEVKPETGD
jgi:hypothetical protein